MQLHGTSDKYALGSTKMLSNLIVLRRFIGSFYSLFFLFFFIYYEHHVAAAIVAFLALLAPLTYGYAFFNKKNKAVFSQLSNFISTIFSLVIVLLVYLAQDIDFIYLMAYPTTIAVYSASNYRYRWLLLIVSNVLIAFILNLSLSTYTVMVFLTTYVLVLSFSHFFSMRIHSDNQILASLALRDSLTGLHNRRALEVDMEDAKVLESLNSVIFLDIDHFKQINDEHGHIFGDEVLKTVANAIKQTIDEKDKAYRFGGEEFVVVSRGSTDGMQKCLEIKAAITKIRLLKDAYSNQDAVTFTASIGLAPKEQGKTLHKLVRDSDAAMYFAKENGRNQVVLFDSAMQQVKGG